MPRLFAPILLLVLGTTVYAAPMIEMKNIKAGEGCEQPYKKASSGPDICKTLDSKIRIWCPNGTSFERDDLPNVAVSRSICHLSQLP
jgi:hypothetical protein